MTRPARAPRRPALPRALRRFARAERASLSIEAAIMLPLLVFLYAAGFTWFDAYRRDSHTFKATYAIADVLSRRTDLVTPAELDGLQGVFEALVGAAPAAAFMRFSELHRSPAGVEVVWSYATDGQPALSTARLQGLLRQVPTLVPGERVTLVETHLIDRPILRVGLGERRVINAIPTRQRYEPRLPFAPGAGRANDASVRPNNLDCGDAIVPLGGRPRVGPGNCAG